MDISSTHGPGAEGDPAGFLLGAEVQSCLAAGLFGIPDLDVEIWSLIGMIYPTRGHSRYFRIQKPWEKCVLLCWLYFVFFKIASLVCLFQKIGFGQRRFAALASFIEGGTLKSILCHHCVMPESANGGCSWCPGLTQKAGEVGFGLRQQQQVMKSTREEIS